MFVNLNVSYSYSGIMRNLILLKKNYPRLLALRTAGVSHDGRDIPLVRVGKGDIGTLCIAGVHSRENINPIVLVAIIEKLARTYYSAGEILLDNYAIYFMPLMNPDGYEISTRGFGAIRNDILRYRCEKIQPDYSGYKFNARGVDINRNFACQAFMPSLYSGACNSENETLTLIRVCRDNELLGMIDFHSRGNNIYYHRAAMSEEYNQKQLQIAQQLSLLTGYSLNSPELENPDNLSGGNTVQFFSETYHKPAITIETVEEEADFPLDKKYQSVVFDAIKEVPLTFLNLLVHGH